MTDTHDPYAQAHPGGHDPGRHDPVHGDHGGEHSLAKYIYVFVALCLLTGASFFTYSEFWPYHHKPAIGWFFMMAVSCSKASLVILFFMHLKYEADWKYVLTIPASLMSAFLVIALVPDVGMRVNRYSEERKEFVGTQADRQKIESASAIAGAAHDDSHDHAPADAHKH